MKIDDIEKFRPKTYDERLNELTEIYLEDINKIPYLDLIKLYNEYYDKEIPYKIENNKIIFLLTDAEVYDFYHKLNKDGILKKYK